MNAGADIDLTGKGYTPHKAPSRWPGPELEALEIVEEAEESGLRQVPTWPLRKLYFRLKPHLLEKGGPDTAPIIAAFENAHVTTRRNLPVIKYRALLGLLQRYLTIIDGHEGDQIKRRPGGTKGETWGLRKLSHPLKAIIAKGKVTLIMAPSGTGKTNVLTAIVEEFLKAYATPYAIITNIAFKDKMHRLAARNGGKIINVTNDKDFVRAYADIYEEALNKVLDTATPEQCKNDEYLEIEVDKAQRWGLVILDEQTGAVGKSQRKYGANAAFLSWAVQWRKEKMIPMVVFHSEDQIPTTLKEGNVIHARIYIGSEVREKPTKDGAQELAIEIIEAPRCFNHNEIWLSKGDNQFRHFLNFKTRDMVDFYHHNDPTTIRYKVVDPQDFFYALTGKKGRRKLDTMRRFLGAPARADPRDIVPTVWEKMTPQQIADLLGPYKPKRLTNLFPEFLEHRDKTNIKEIVKLYETEKLSFAQLGLIFNISASSAEKKYKAATSQGAGDDA